MYEEDRQRALEEYEEIFEEAGNENAVLQLLVSPTRQAVNLARAYDSRDRRSPAEEEEAPAYLAVIEDLRRQAGALIPEVPPAADDDQISLFEEPDVAETVFDSLELGSLPELEPDDLPETPPAEIDHYPDEDRSAETAPPPAVPERSLPAEETPDREADDFSDSVEAFLADFTVRGEKAGENAPAHPAEFPDSEREESSASVPERIPAADRHDEDRSLPAEPRKRAPDMRADELPELPDLPAMTKKKPNTALLILFILIAAPITLLLVGLLLLPAALCLGLAAAGLCLGFSGLVAAFTSFPVFADILLVFGLALVLAALGLLLFWCFVWFLAGAIPGLIRGVCGLARKLCYREVAV